MFQEGHSLNKGKVLTTRALVWDEVQIIKTVTRNARDKALLSLALGSGLRASDIVGLRWADLEDDGERLTALIRVKKTKQLKRIVLNASVSADLRAWQDECVGEFVATGQRGQLTVGSWARIVKALCVDAGVDAKNVGSHSLRKARCRALVDQYQVPLYKVMMDLGHSSEAMTARYIGITTREMAAMYEHVI